MQKWIKGILIRMFIRHVAEQIEQQHEKTTLLKAAAEYAIANEVERHAKALTKIREREAHDQAEIDARLDVLINHSQNLRARLHSLEQPVKSGNAWHTSKEVNKA